MESQISINENNPSDGTQNDLIRFVDVTKIFKSGHVMNYALDKVNLSIKEGETLSIVGERASAILTLCFIPPLNS